MTQHPRRDIKRKLRVLHHAEKPKLRQQNFETAIIERYRRRESSVKKH